MTERDTSAANGYTEPIGPTPQEIDSTDGPTRRTIDPSSQWFWPIINLIGLIGVVATNVLANIMEFNGLSTGDVVNQDPVYFQPAGFTFSIWSLIYILLAAFVVYTFLPAGRRNPRIRTASALFLLSNIANGLWIVVWHYAQWTASLAVMGVLVLSLILIYYVLRRGRGHAAQPTTIERLMVWTPFSVYIGWVSVATGSNIAVWSDRTGNAIWGMDGRWLAVSILFVLLGCTLLMTTWLRDPTYAAVIVWASAGIAVEQWDRSTLVVVMASITLLIAVTLAIFGSLLAFETRQRGHVLPSAPESTGKEHFWQRNKN